MPYLDANGDPIVTPPPKVYLDPNTGEPTNSEEPDFTGPSMTADDAQKAFKAGVYSKMLGTDPAYAYQNADEIHNQLQARDPEYDNDNFVGAVETGFEETPLGMLLRGKAPDPFESNNALLRFVHSTTSFVSDPVVVVPTIAGAIADVAVPGAAVGGFVGGAALDAGLRKAMMDHYQKGDVKSFGELADRTGDALWEATKGALGAEAFSFAGDLPVPGAIADKPLASIGLRGLYQAAAITTAGSLLNGQVPKLQDFEDSALAVVPLNLATGGLLLRGADTKQALMDVYAENGTTPQASEEKLAAQPPVKPEPEPGLRPAIKFEGAVVEADVDEHHADLAERSFGQQPVTMAELEADPTQADKVLQTPEIHDQAVIDKAWELKKEALDLGEGAVYHGTPAEYEGAPNTDGLGAHFTPDRKVAEAVAGKTGRVIEGNLNLQNPLRVEDIPGSHSEAQGTVENLVKQGVLPEEFLKDVQEGAIYKRSQEIVGDIGDLQGPELGKKRNDAYAQANNEVLEKVKSYLKSKGYDGLVYENKVEGGGDSYVAFDKGQIDVGPKTIDQLYDRGEMKSGRGFVTPDGKFLDRNAAKRWVKDNEPQTHEMWSKIAGDDKQAFHADDYGQARMRVQNRNVAEGEPDLAGASPELTKFLGKNRAELNAVKAGGESSAYGNSVLRTLLVGPRNLLRAEGAQVVSRMQRLIPEARDQEALSFLRDYKDAPQELQQAIEEIRSGSNEKLKAFIPSMERALNPSPEMLQADQELTQYFGKALDMGRQLGILDSGIDPSRYSPRLFVKVFDDAESSGTGWSKLATKSPNAIRREYLRLLDPLKSGDIEARTFNALDELNVYADRHATAVSTKLLMTELENTELGTHGTQEDHPDGWRELNPGKRSLAGFYVPKVVSDAIAPMLREGEPQLAHLLSMQNYVKGLELGLSAFHMKALTITAMNNMSFAEFSKSLVSDNQSAEFEARETHAALYGLETTKTGVPVEAYQGLKASSLPTGLDKLYNVPVIKQVDAFAKSITRETFDTIQRKFKVMDFSQKESAWMAKNPDATDVEYGKAMRGIAKEVNAAYGGLNWDVLGVSKGMQNFSRLLMLAPDWTFSNVLNLKYAGEGGAAGSAARSFWVKSYVTGFAMSAAMSQLIGGKYDLKRPEMVYMGKDDKGKDIYANWFFAGAPKDSITLAHRVLNDGPLRGMAEFLVGKLGPIAGTVAGLSFNTDPSGKPISKRGADFVDKTEDQAEFATGKLVPITGKNAVETVTRMLSDPDKKYTYKDVLEAVGDVVGVTTIHQGESGKKETSRRGGFHLPGVSRGFRLPGAR